MMGIIKNGVREKTITQVIWKLISDFIEFSNSLNLSFSQTQIIDGTIAPNKGKIKNDNADKNNIFICCLLSSKSFSTNPVMSCLRAKDNFEILSAVGEPSFFSILCKVLKIIPESSDSFSWVRFCFKF